VEQNRKTEQNSVIFPIVVGFILAIVLLGVAGIFLPKYGTARPKARKISCASNLKQIGLALKQYSMDYDDNFPAENGAAGLELLRRNNYLTDYKIYTCPSASIKSGSGTAPLTEPSVSYVFRGGLTETDPADSAICWDKPDNHKKYGNILFVDGHVQGFAGANWMDNIK
jgi:prepilin-type processing-associated H-X9-DG protein